MSLLRNDFPHPGAAALLFDQPVSLLADIREAVALLTTITADRLRRENLLAQKLVVWIEMIAGAGQLPQILSQTIDLPVPIASVGVLGSFTSHAVDDLYRPGGRYRQAGVYCEDLSPDQSELVTRLRRHIERSARPYGTRGSRMSSIPEKYLVPAWA